MFTKNIVVQMSKCPKVTNFLLSIYSLDFYVCFTSVHENPLTFSEVTL